MSTTTKALAEHIERAARATNQTLTSISESVGVDEDSLASGDLTVEEVHRISAELEVSFESLAVR